MPSSFKNSGATTCILVDVYEKQFQYISELAVAAWTCSPTVIKASQIESVQKTFCHIILDTEYRGYTLTVSISFENLKMPERHLWFWPLKQLKLVIVPATLPLSQDLKHKKSKRFGPESVSQLS